MPVIESLKHPVCGICKEKPFIVEIDLVYPSIFQAECCRIVQAETKEELIEKVENEMREKMFTGYKFKEEKIYDGDILIIHEWCNCAISPDSDYGKYDRIVKRKVVLSEYETEEPRGDSVLHCGWNVDGIPLPYLVKNEYLLDSNSYTKCEGIEKS